MKRYVFQVGKRVEKDCSIQEYRMGQPVDVKAACVVKARRSAALEVLARSQSYNASSNDPYSSWLGAEANGYSLSKSQYFWFYHEEKVVG